MARQNLEDVIVSDPRFKRGFRFEKVAWTPADNAVFDINFPPYVELNPAGAVDILMPTSSAARAGLMFLLSNPSANTVTLKTDGDAAFATAIALLTIENTIVFCTGSTTQNLGWRALGTASSA